jgi:hypothetical protein
VHLQLRRDYVLNGDGVVGNVGNTALDAAQIDLVRAQ